MDTLRNESRGQYHEGGPQRRPRCGAAAKSAQRSLPQLGIPALCSCMSSALRASLMCGRPLTPAIEQEEVSPCGFVDSQASCKHKLWVTVPFSKHAAQVHALELPSLHRPAHSKHLPRAAKRVKDLPRPFPCTELMRGSLDTHEEVNTQQCTAWALPKEGQYVGWPALVVSSMAFYSLWRVASRSVQHTNQHLRLL